MAGQGLRGYQVERLFEDRLIALGYGPILWPRQDQGVDCVVWSDRGWVGVQIKTLAYRGPRPERSQYFPSITLMLASQSSAFRYKSWARKTGKAYYASRGITVIAGFVNGGFYLLPLSECNDKNTHIGPRLKKYWEAWGEVIGLPVSLQRIAEKDEPAKADQLEVMWEKS